MRHEVITGCRSCSSPDLKLVLDLGAMPLADALVPSHALNSPRYPLSVVFCEACSLVQILETVPPEQLYGADYLYFSSFSDALLEHSRRNVERLIAERELGAGHLAVEIASNDGYLLKYFADNGVAVLGVDPAPGPAQAAIDKGIPTLNTFFTEELATKLVSEGRSADVIVANNVLAHVPDQNDLVAGIAALLAPGGVASVEFPYVADLIARCEFDTIYHEHHCYFSVTSVSRLFARHGLTVFDVEHLDIHGGSLRISAGHTEPTRSSVRDYLANEAKLGLTSFAHYEDFAERTRRVRAELVPLLGSLKAEGKTIAAYGAAAKGTTLLNYTGIGTDLIDFVVDRNTHKHGLNMPGVHIPIKDASALVAEMPDYVLLLAWNFVDEILAQQSEYRERGGRFIVPIPTPEVV